MEEVAIIGVGMHAFGKFLNSSLTDLSRVAVWNAIHDASIPPKRIEAAYVGNSLGGLVTGQEGVRGQVILRNCGVTGIPVTNVEGACASSTIALREAWIAISAGVHDVALVLGVEKMFMEDTAQSLKALAADSDIELLGGLGFQFVGNYAMLLRKFMEKSGCKQEHFAKITVKNKHNGSLNPYAQYRNSVTIEEVLNSRVVAYPLTLFMCSSMADGAAAAILCSKDIAAKFTSKPLINIAACELVSGTYNIPGEPHEELTTRAAMKAYEKAGIGPEDINVVEVHDAMAPAEMRLYEELNLCKPGEAVKLIDEQQTALTGRIPVNPSGGLAAKGHPISATGLAQINEIVLQLRGEAGARQITNDPKVGLTENAGGWVMDDNAACAVTILKKA